MLYAVGIIKAYLIKIINQLLEKQDFSQMRREKIRERMFIEVDLGAEDFTMLETLLLWILMMKGCAKNV